MIFFSLSARAKLQSLLKEFSPNDPPCVLVLAGAGEALPSIAQTLSKEAQTEIVTATQLPNALQKGKVYLVDSAQHVDAIWSQFGSKRETSVFVFGKLAPKTSSKILAWGDIHLILEDLGGGKATAELSEVAADILPATSYTYVSHAFFAKKKAA